MQQAYPHFGSKKLSSESGGVEINGIMSNNIYRASGDLIIVPTINILIKTNYGTQEAMKMNTTDTSCKTTIRNGN